MTDLKFNLLKMLYEASPLHPLKELDLINSGYAEPLKIDAAIEDLIEQKYIKTAPCSNSIKIDSPGRIAFESEKEHRDQQAKQEAEKHADQLAMMSLSEVQRKKQFRHDFVVSAFSAVIGSLLTLLAVNIPQLIDAIFSLIK